MKTNEQSTIERLFSLDALRGLDMILLTVVGPLVFSAQKCWGCFPDGFMRQFNHGWECFTLWDIIMPLFIFMCGAAVPFALERRLKEGKGVFWRHVLSQVNHFKPRSFQSSRDQIFANVMHIALNSSDYHDPLSFNACLFK